MSIQTFKSYDGNQPYIFLNFSQKDLSKAEPVLNCLYNRGVRVYFVQKSAKKMNEAVEIQKKIRNASYMAYLVFDINNPDEEQKDFGHYFESQKKPFAVFGSGITSEGMLGLGFFSNPKFYNIPEKADGSDYENAIIHADGFAREMIGQPVSVASKKWKLIGAVACLIALLSIGAFFITRSFFYFGTDTYIFEDATIQSGVKSACNQLKLPVTEETMKRVETIHLDKYPNNISEIKKLNNLKKIIIPKNLAEEFLDLSDEYVIVLEDGIF